MFACHADGRSKPFLHSSCRYVCAKMTRVKLRMNPPIQKPITVNCQLRQCLFEIPVRNLMQLDRKLDRHDTALPVWTVLQFKRAAVRLCNLTREHKSNAAASWLRCVERYKSIARIYQARSLVLDRDDHILGSRFPGEHDLLFGIRRLRSV